MAPLLLIHKTPLGVVNVPLASLQGVAEYLADKGLTDTFWENVAGDRLGVIFDLKAELRKVQSDYDELAAFLGPVKEAAK